MVVVGDVLLLLQKYQMSERFDLLHFLKIISHCIRLIIINSHTWITMMKSSNMTEIRRKLAHEFVGCYFLGYPVHFCFPLPMGLPNRCYVTLFEMFTMTTTDTHT